MKVPSYKPVSRINVPDAPEWLDKLRDTDIAQTKKISQALQNQLGLEDNLNAEVITTEVTHNVWTSVAINKVRGKPWKVELAFVDVPKGVDLNWLPLRWIPEDQKRVAIKLSFYVAGFVADPGYAIPVTIEVWGH